MKTETTLIRNGRGKQKQIAYVVANIYNEDVWTFTTMQEIVERLGIPMQSINRKVRGIKGLSYPHLTIERLRQNGNEVNRDKWEVLEDGKAKRIEND